MVYIGKYDGYVHALDGGRFIVGRNFLAGVCTHNPPKAEPPCWQRITPLKQPLFADTFEELAELGAPTYANPNSAIKAARRVYPNIRDRFPWRECRGSSL